MDTSTPFIAPPSLPNPMRELREMHQEAMQSQLLLSDQLQQLIALQQEQNQLLSRLLDKQ